MRIEVKISTGEITEWPDAKVIQDSAVPNKRIAEIKAELEALDKQSIRPAREISSALATGQSAPALSVSKIVSIEAKTAALRDELEATTS